ADHLPELDREPDHLTDLGNALARVRVEQRLGRLVVEEQIELPGEVRCVAHTGAHALAGDRRHLMRGLAGGKDPTDRPMDGVASNRDHVLLFLGQKPIAVKWRNYKLHLDGLDRVDGVSEDCSFPRAFNLASDPKERSKIILAELVARRGDRAFLLPHL